MYSKEQQLNDTRQFRKRKCKACGTYFRPEREGQVVCNNTECPVEYAGKSFKKQIKREKAKEKKKFNENDKSYLMKKAQDTFNRYIRKRDEGQPCISCGDSMESRQVHAGHYRPVGKNGQHRFNEDNCHSQCSICNNHLSGNLVNYREGLIFKIGEKRVVALENHNSPKHWTIEELKSIIKKYDKKYKDL